MESYSSQKWIMVPISPLDTRGVRLKNGSGQDSGIASLSQWEVWLPAVIHWGKNRLLIRKRS